MLCRHPERERIFGQTGWKGIPDFLQIWDCPAFANLRPPTGPPFCKSTIKILKR